MYQIMLTPNGAKSNFPGAEQHKIRSFVDLSISCLQRLKITARSPDLDKGYAKGFAGAIPLTLTIVTKVFGLFFIGFVLFFPSPRVLAVTVVELGIGSPDDDVSVQDVAALRSRAIRNLMEVAVLRVSGAIISGEQKETERLWESQETTGDEVKEKLKQDSAFHNTIISRIHAYAKLLEIIKEWRADDQYYIRAKVDVREESLQDDLKNAGILWERVGKPTIYLAVNRSDNEQHGYEDKDVLKKLRDALAEHGLNVITHRQRAAFSIDVEMTLKTSYVAQFGTYKTDCVISYEIIDTGVGMSLAASRKSSGPDGGFSVEQTQSTCLDKVVPALADDMVKQLIHEMNEIWINGRKFRVTITNIDGKSVTATTNRMKNIFRVMNLSNLKYQSGNMQADVQYKGLPFEFVENLMKSFEYDGSMLNLVALEENRIELRVE